ncbi:MAG: hypothetical protein WC236_13890 [Gallionellaceae bacterium]|jgi:hypothetical protein
MKLKYALSEKEIDLLNGYQKRYEEGDGMALFEAMEECALRGWLMPSWVHSEFLAGLMRYRRCSVKDLGDAFKLPKQSLKRAHWRMLVPLAQGNLMMELSEYISNHVPAKPSMLNDWEILADAIAENFRRIGWPPPTNLSGRTLQRIWQENKT